MEKVDMVGWELEEDGWKEIEISVKDIKLMDCGWKGNRGGRLGWREIGWIWELGDLYLEKEYLRWINKGVCCLCVVLK